MEPYENFRPRCSIADANRLVEQITPEIGFVSLNCYADAYKNCEGKDIRWKQHTSMASVYMLGFISGARAVRERKK